MDAMSMWIMLLGGGAILLIGVYLVMTANNASGVVVGSRTGVGNGEPVAIPGWGFVLIGALMFLPGLIMLIGSKGKN